MSFLNPAYHFRAIYEIVGIVFAHRRLTWELAKRELRDRYAGSIAGRIWAIVHPFALLTIYAVVFGFVFVAKLDARGPVLDYTAYLIAGFLPWMSTQDSFNKSCGAITTNSNLVKQVVFPIEVLPVKMVLSSLVFQLVGSVFLAAYLVFRTGGLPPTFALVPVLIAVTTVGLTGVGFLLSAVGVFVRDLREVVQVGMLASMYLLPLFYLPNWVPEWLLPVLYANPFSYMIWCYQDACYFGEFAHPLAWVVFPFVCLFTFSVGYSAFRQLKPQFGNLL